MTADNITAATTPTHPPDDSVGDSLAIDPSATGSSSTDPAVLHADKYNDPRVRITRRGILTGVVITLVASLAAIGSILARRTRLDRTTEFFGPVVIEALQLAERIDLIPRVDDPASSGFPAEISLTATPGLGHLRRALLDDRHYDWDRTEDTAAVAGCDNSTYGEKNIPGCLSLRLSDPTLNRFQPVQMDLNLIDGVVGLAESGRRVHVTDYVRPKLQNYFATIINVSRLTYDDRPSTNDAASSQSATGH